MATIVDLLILFVFGFAAGTMIGSVGIGGVILVPLLSYVGGIDIHIAIAAAMFAFLISGITGTLFYAKNRSINWQMAAWLWAGAMPAAFIGALTASVLPKTSLELCLGLLTSITGLHSLRGSAGSEKEIHRERQPPVLLVVIGAVTGMLSALTGTGGPLVLIPILMWCRVPVLMAIGLSKAIQLPIGTLATSGNIYAGTLDLMMGIALGAGISLGTVNGGNIAHRLPREMLRRIVSVLLIVVGALILAKLAHHHLE
ncbi:MAG: sulfite exporter TauE/SafE family protein [Geminicoccaceae bacterium]